MSLKIIPSALLFKRACLAMIKPHRVISAISQDERINYFQVVPIMVVWGFCYGLLHFFAIYGKWPWKIFSTPSSVRGIFLAFTFGSLSNWLMAIFGFFMLKEITRRKPSIYQIEVACFYVWFLWAVMPLFDFAHRLVFIPTYTFVLPIMWSGFREIFVFHFSWLLFPILIVQVFFILKYLVGPKFPWKGIAVAANVLLTVAIVLHVRIVFESSATMVLRKLSKLGYSVFWWQIAGFLSIFGFLEFLSFRLYLIRRSRVLLAVFLIFVFLGTMMSWLDI